MTPATHVARRSNSFAGHGKSSLLCPNHAQESAFCLKLVEWGVIRALDTTQGAVFGLLRGDICSHQWLSDRGSKMSL